MPPCCGCDTHIVQFSLCAVHFRQPRNLSPESEVSEQYDRNWLDLPDETAAKLLLKVLPTSFTFPSYTPIIFFVFVSFIQSRARKIQMSFFNVESIGSIFIVFKRMRDRHCVNIAHVSVPRKSRFPLPHVPSIAKSKKKTHEKAVFMNVRTTF